MYKQSSIVLALFLGQTQASSLQNFEFNEFKPQSEQQRLEYDTQLSKAFQAYSQKIGNNKDIAETHVDPWVYDKVAPNVEWAPLGRPDNEPKVDKYWETKQSVKPAELSNSLTQRNRAQANEDVGKEMIDPWVQKFSNDNVDRLPYGRKETPPSRDSYTPPEGGKPNGAVWSQPYKTLHQYDGEVPTWQYDGRKGDAPKRDSYTPPVGDKPNGAVWTKPYDSLNKHKHHKHHSHHSQSQQRDISEKQIDEQVHDFANDNVDRLNWPRNKDAFDVNGLKNPESGYGYVPPAELLQHHNHYHNKDISEKQMDEEVHGLANPNSETLNWTRSKDPFVMNGSKNPESGYGYVAPAELIQHKHHKHHHNKDISEKQIDEEVHGLSNPLTEYPNWNRSKEPFIDNGSKNPGSGYGYVPPAELIQHHNHHHHHNKDISEKQMDEEVHGLANPNSETLNWTRSKDPFVMNGSKNPESGYGYVAPAELIQHKHHKHHHKNKKDISEKQIDEEVHGLANPNSETLNWTRSKDPFVMNGSKNPESGYGYVASADDY